MGVSASEGEGVVSAAEAAAAGDTAFGADEAARGLSSLGVPVAAPSLLPRS